MIEESTGAGEWMETRTAPTARFQSFSPTAKVQETLDRKDGETPPPAAFSNHELKA